MRYLKKFTFWNIVWIILLISYCLFNFFVEGDVYIGSLLIVVIIATIAVTLIEAK